MIAFVIWKAALIECITSGQCLGSLRLGHGYTQSQTRTGSLTHDSQFSRGDNESHSCLRGLSSQEMCFAFSLLLHKLNFYLFTHLFLCLLTLLTPLKSFSNSSRECNSGSQLGKFCSLGGTEK